MKFLIKIQSDSELINYEAISLGLTLASFDHQVQFYFSGLSHVILNDSRSRTYGMVQSLSLYDIKQPWISFDKHIILNTTIDDMMLHLDDPPKMMDFDGILEF
ncbi:hypothetical protein [Moraxella sp. Pampa]|uniref:hypothetical protein n=1 Tax=Moraxella sp. Pampa TaxID=3111978 RepID=UPI002B411FB1|nr:hypothetical protein [Moraxella sp. Pampa]